MTKISGRDILDILRLYEIANEDTTVREISRIKIEHPSLTNTIATFKFAKRTCGVLFDDDASDDTEIVLSEIKKIVPSLTFELVKNPTESKLAYGVPYKGKDCYLFVEKVEKVRLDVKLSELYPNTSRSTWQKYIKSGYISVDGQVADSPKQPVKTTAKITVNLPQTDKFQDKTLPIIYQDENVIVVNKPAGVLTHAKGVLNDEFTVADFFRRYTTFGLDTNRPGIVHRLDRDTSGVIIGARNPETAKLLQKQFADRKTKKIYYAITDGIPKTPEANIDLPIDRNPKAPSTFKVSPNGKNALTYYKVIAQNGEKALIELQPKTGRTHQLRVHLKYLGTPITGDRVYGKPADRLYLHARSLEITIPTSSRQTFVAPLPEEFLTDFPGVKI